MTNLFELRKEVSQIKNKLQTIVSESTYDKIIKISKAESADQKLIDALTLLEDSVVELNKAKMKL